MDPQIEGAWNINKDNVILIEMHSDASGDPFYSSKTGQRLLQYINATNWLGYPTVYVDGPNEPPWVYTIANVSNTINMRHDLDTPITINLTGQPGSNVNKIDFTANINSEMSIQSQNLKFILFIVESVVEFDKGIGPGPYFNVVLDIIPDQNGTNINFSNANDLSETVTGSVDISNISRHADVSPLNINNVKFVGIVQDLSTMEVYQAAEMSFTYLDVEEDKNAAGATNFAINNLYPNPFNPTVNVTFSITDNEFVNLSVFNILGEEVASLFEGKQFAPGNYHFDWNASGLSTGTYFFKLSAQNRTSIKKAIYLK